MTLDDPWLASVEVEAHAVNNLVDSTLPNDALLLIREVRRLRAERDAYEQALREMVDALECEKPLAKLALHVGQVALGRVR